MFEAQTRNLPRATEAERLVIQRVGQDVFRDALMTYWNGRCAVTGVAQPRLLRASHIKPWAMCETDGERLDVYNGLLLAAHLDAAFDAGLISFSDKGAILFSSKFTQDDRDALVIDCRAMELWCIERAKADPKNSWKWLGQAERWQELGHSQVACRFRPAKCPVHHPRVVEAFE